MSEYAYSHLLKQLPYQEPFLFVDRILHLDSESVEGTYTFRKDLDFYRGHFKGFPITPGVLLTECCAQIGLACLGLHILEGEGTQISGGEGIGITESRMEFLQPVFPGETVRVVAEKQYFRFKKLKVSVKLFTESGSLACKGQLAGMLNPNLK